MRSSIHVESFGENEWLNTEKFLLFINNFPDHTMEGMCLKLIPVVVRCTLGPLGIFAPMTGTFWAYS